MRVSVTLQSVVQVTLSAEGYKLWKRDRKAREFPLRSRAGGLSLRRQHRSRPRQHFAPRAAMTARRV